MGVRVSRGLVWPPGSFRIRHTSTGLLGEKEEEEEYSTVSAFLLLLLLSGMSVLKK